MSLFRDHRRRHFDSEQIGQVIMNVTGAYTLGVHRDNFVLNAGYIRLTLLSRSSFQTHRYDRRVHESLALRTHW